MVSLCYTILDIGAVKIEYIEVEEVCEDGAEDGRKKSGWVARKFGRRRTDYRSTTKKRPMSAHKDHQHSHRA